MKTHQIRLVAAMTIYNEEQFIFDSLMSLKKILDLDGIYIADGSWNKEDKYPYSTDGTKTITKLFPDVKWLSCQKHYVSESEKRNKLINWIEQDSNEIHTWILVLDGDEELLFRDQVYKDMFLESQKTIRLKPILSKVDPDCNFAIIESFPQNEQHEHPLEYFQLRFFKAGKGIHWPESYPMRYVDREGKILMDYSYGNWILGQKHLFIKDIVIRNKWYLRSPDRIQKTQEYLQKRMQDAFIKDRIKEESSGHNIFW